MNTPVVKPPWLLETNQWQKFSYIDLPTEITYGAWHSTPSEELSNIKQKISDLEAQGRWELVKKMVNQFEIVYTHEDKQFHPSISLVKPLSRSYFKMIEMLHVLQFFEGLPKQQVRYEARMLQRVQEDLFRHWYNSARRKRKLCKRRWRWHSNR